MGIKIEDVFAVEDIVALRDAVEELRTKYASHNHDGRNSLLVGVDENKIRVVTLVDSATVTLNSTLGDIFHLTAAGNRTILAPTTDRKDGSKFIIRHEASGGSRTLTLTTGSAGAFRFGTTITGLSATGSGLVDYIGCRYNRADDRWDVIAYAQGY